MFIVCTKVDGAVGSNLFVLIPLNRFYDFSFGDTSSKHGAASAQNTKIIISFKRMSDLINRNGRGCTRTHRQKCNAQVILENVRARANGDLIGRVTNRFGDKQQNVTIK